MGLLQHVKLIRHIYPVASNHFLSLVKTKINYANLIEEISCQNTKFLVKIQKRCGHGMTSSNGYIYSSTTSPKSLSLRISLKKEWKHYKSQGFRKSVRFLSLKNDRSTCETSTIWMLKQGLIKLNNSRHANVERGMCTKHPN